MKYLTFIDPEPTEYDIAILVPHINREEIERHYITPHLDQIKQSVIVYDLFRDETKKNTSVKLQKEYLEDLLPTLMDLKVKYLVVTDGEYFKTLTKSASIEKNQGYVLPCVVGNFQVIYCPNFAQVFYNPDKVKAAITQCFDSLKDHIAGSYTDPGHAVIKKAYYPKTVDEIRVWLDRLVSWNVPLTADIEAFSLKHYDAGIGTITFCWNKHEGIAFPVDLMENEADRTMVRIMLRDFFVNFQNRIIWHNISYDVYVLVYQLFMRDLLDTEGLLEGLEILLKNWEDTKLIAYLATNTCAGNHLSLKVLAQEFSGNYAVEEIKDIREIPLKDLLQYNLVDGLSTWYVVEKYWDKMIADQQFDIYVNLFKPAIVDIIQMQLTGLPLDMEQVKKTKIELEGYENNAISRMQQTQVVQAFTYWLNEQYVEKMNAKWVKKRITLADAHEEFNPHSAPQLQKLLYGEDFLDLPVLDYTDSKLPATGKETLEKLKNHTTDPDVQAFLLALIDYKDVAIILSTFIPAMLRSPQAPDGWYYLYGNFNLGGTVSGRLSSNNPNLQNLPATGSKYAKTIKKCFKAPPGWLLVGLDFASLEDRISALTTRDPNKLKVYTDGYDGHCLRAYAYFSDQMNSNIDPTDPVSINSIKDFYPDQRQKSKTPTFALTYQGTYITLMANSGFSEELAKKIEKAYHELYKVSDDWVNAQIALGSKQGYVTCAFGLRVRTPLLEQVILGNKKTPFEAAAEGRTAGNALGQSWCLLNSRAGSEFMYGVRAGNYRLDIKPCAQIHDAGYFLIKDQVSFIHYTNENLVRAVQWQADPLIAHPHVKLGGEVSIFYPNWSKELVIPNGANEVEILELANTHWEEINGQSKQ